MSHLKPLTEKPLRPPKHSSASSSVSSSSSYQFKRIIPYHHLIIIIIVISSFSSQSHPANSALSAVSKSKTQKLFFNHYGNDRSSVARTAPVSPSIRRLNETQPQRFPSQNPVRDLDFFIKDRTRT